MRGALRLAAAAAAIGAVGGGLARAAVPEVGRALRLDGRRVQVLDRGRGRPVVLVHGLGGGLLNFARLWPLLEDFRVVAADRAGAGRSDAAAPAASSLAGQAARLAAVMERLETGPAVIVGHSLGGAVALQLAADRPDLVAGLVTLGALTRPEYPRLARGTVALARLPAVPEVAAALLTAPLAPVLGGWTLWLSFAPDPIPPGFLTQGGGLLTAQPRAVAAVMRDIEVVAEGIGALQPRLSGLRMPVAILHGTEDHVLTPDCARHLAALIPQARLHLGPGGHMLPWTHPGRVAAAIRSVA